MKNKTTTTTTTKKKERMMKIRVGIDERDRSGRCGESFCTLESLQNEAVQFFARNDQKKKKRDSFFFSFLNFHARMHERHQKKKKTRERK